MAEKIELKKRVFELSAGDIFWFSGNWRIVVRIDRDQGLLWYKAHREDGGGTHESLMCKSQMLVALKSDS